MLTEICQEIKNYFETNKIFGDFTIEAGKLVQETETDYIRIVGSKYNDGVHHKDEELKDETFKGAIWEMIPPPAFLNLADEIAGWQETNGKADSVAMSPFNSESFAGYSYSKGTEARAHTWAGAYETRLNPYRRIHV